MLSFRQQSTVPSSYHSLPLAAIPIAYIDNQGFLSHLNGVEGKVFRRNMFCTPNLMINRKRRLQ